MKVFLPACLAVLSACATAFALNPCSQLDTYAPAFRLKSETGHTSTTFSSVDFSRFQAVADGCRQITPGPDDTSRYADKRVLQRGFVFLGDAATTPYSYADTGTSGASSLSAVTLEETLAPEAVSAALVGACLIALPFTRHMNTLTTRKGRRTWLESHRTKL